MLVVFMGFPSSCSFISTVFFYDFTYVSMPQLNWELMCSYFHSLSLSVPQITEEPDSQENVIPRKPAEFAVKAIGKNLTYTWHRQAAEQSLPSDKKVLVGNTQILRIDKVESDNEGYYVCTICNPTGGSVETKPAQLTTSM